MSQVPMPPVYYAPPPAPTGLNAVPTPVWVIGGALGGYVLLSQTGVGNFFGSAFDTVGSTVDGVGDHIIDPTLQVSGKVIGLGGKAVDGVGNFFDNLFTGRNALTGRESLVPVFPFNLIL